MGYLWIQHTAFRIRRSGSVWNFFRQFPGRHAAALPDEAVEVIHTFHPGQVGDLLGAVAMQIYQLDNVFQTSPEPVFLRIDAEFEEETAPGVFRAIAE